ncbi:MAG: pirin family protein [Planctomycetes bacterium]|nr:pirin family protein [Planctomycetota bacterium]
MKPIEAVYTPPSAHWVGDGFHVRGYFNVIPDGMRRMSPFLLLDYGAPEEFPPADNTRRGVGPHPHRGFETVTIAYQGSVAHHDSTGSGGVIAPGDVQWMTAGAGILHREYHAEDFARAGGAMQMAQIWVNLPHEHKLTAPRYQAITADRMGVHEFKGGSVRVIAGEHAGVKGPAATFSPVHMYDVELKSGASHRISLPAHYNTALLVMKGGLSVNGKQASADDFVLFKNEGEKISLEAHADTRLLVLSGEPINEPIANYGPFVMNTPEEIAQAISDFQTGKFGHLDE